MSVLVQEETLSVLELTDIQNISKERRFMEIYLAEKVHYNHHTALARARSTWFRPEV